MIDFQKGGLEPQVYELLLKAGQLCGGVDIPLFVRKKQDDGKWSCKFEIPGILPATSKDQKTEVAAINRCASNMLHILNNLDSRGIYDPKDEESVFKEEIESVFGNIDYNPEYFYHLLTGSILLGPDEGYMKQKIAELSQDLTDVLEEHDEEIDKICNIITVKYLVKQKKKNYC